MSGRVHRPRWLRSVATLRGLARLGLVFAVLGFLSGTGFAQPEVSIVASDPTASEDGDAGEFTITRSGLLPLTNLEVHFSVTGTAVNGADYVEILSPVTIPALSNAATIVVIPIDDNDFEGNETVVLTLLADSEGDYTIGDPAAATVTIADNDDAVLPVVTVFATDPIAPEGGTGAFTFERTGGGGAPLTVSYSVAGSATPGNDYVVLPGRITFGTGMTTATLTVTPVEKQVPEGNKSVVVSLAAGAGYAIGSPASATVVIGGQALPDLEITGPVSAAAGSSVSLTISSPSETITGTWRFEFAPDPGIPGNRQVDDRIALSAASFSVPGGTTVEAGLTVTLGTVAGTVSIIAEASGIVLAEHQIAVEPGPPRVTGAQIVIRSYGFDVVVFGFSSRLDVATATFVFRGPNVQQPGPVDVASAFRNWFEHPNSAADGTMFEYTQPFNVDGNRGALTSVTITLVGANGDASAPFSVPIP